jgi:lysozyme
MVRQINKAGIDLIKSFEGLKLLPYLCSAKVPTIGYGTTFYEDGRKVSLQDPQITEARAEQLLATHLGAFAAKVEKMVSVPMTDNQFAALCSFAYNCGPANLASSTLLKKMNAQDYAGAAQEFEKWNKAGGKALTGLTRRRQAEKALFMHSPSQNSSLPAGPSAEDIEAKLASIEKDIL